jgi:hypothetical protein
VPHKASKKELEETRKQVEKELQDAFGVNMVDVSTLHLWRILLDKEPRLAAFKIHVAREQLWAVMQLDLETLRSRQLVTETVQQRKG